MQEVKVCGSCGEPVYWLKHDGTGRPAPIEVKTDPKGNVAISSTCYHIVPADLRAKFSGLHLNHFAHCPQAATWKRHGSRSAQ
jgi:hypothetical protein